MFVTFTIVQENSYIYRYETSKIDRQWYWDHAIKFARWQHPAIGHGARFVCLAWLVFLSFQTFTWPHNHIHVRRPLQDRCTLYATPTIRYSADVIFILQLPGPIRKLRVNHNTFTNCNPFTYIALHSLHDIKLRCYREITRPFLLLRMFLRKKTCRLLTSDQHHVPNLLPIFISPYNGRQNKKKI